MESRFGADFAGVRVHTDGRSVRTVRALHARAYTIGRDIFFDAGQYRPHSADGRRLLAHELTHVVQQSGGRAVRIAASVRPAHDGYEREADHVARAVADGGPDRAGLPRIRRLAAGVVQRATLATTGSWRLGDGTMLVPVPEEHRSRVEDALAILSRIINSPQDYPDCPKFFESHCPGGSSTSLKDAFDRAVVWLWKFAPEEHSGVAGAVGAKDIGYSEQVYRVGRWALAATFIHELIHVCGQDSHDLGDQAKEVCGRLPNLRKVSGGIEIENPL